MYSTCSVHVSIVMHVHCTCTFGTNCKRTGNYPFKNELYMYVTDLLSHSFLQL